MNIKYIYNPDLKVEPIGEVLFNVYTLYDDLEADEWIVVYPRQKFIELYKKVRTINPLKWKDNPRFWDTTKGFDVFNNALSAMTQKV